MGNEHRTYHFHIDTCLFNPFMVRTAMPASISIPYFSVPIVTIATATTCKAYKSYFHSNLLNYKAVTFEKNDGEDSANEGRIKRT